jgi:hypothetical protein
MSRRDTLIEVFEKKLAKKDTGKSFDKEFKLPSKDKVKT